ncbi:MAG TPA: universal stress protein [Solirubrobacteraceae bacterium]|nr:universal stress protein [Solirubrobacteraceae bacterium]
MFTKIVVGIDGRQGGRDAIALARLLAAPGAAITLANVYRSHSLRDSSVERNRMLREIANELLERERAAAGIDARLIAVGGSAVGTALKRLADRAGSDLLVVGSCHHGRLGRALLGDDARSAVTEAPCAVAVAPAGYEPPEQLERIGVGYDGSRGAIAALEIARSIARAQDGRVLARTVVSLQDIPYGEPIPHDWPKVAIGLMDEKQRALRGLGDIDADATYGEPGDELAQYSEHLDLLLVGARGYGPVASLFESSSSRYLSRHSRCPLVVVPPSIPAAKTTSGPTLVVGYDGSAAARAALETAAREATPQGKVVIVTAYELPTNELKWPEYGHRLSENHEAGLALLDDLPLGMPPLAGPRYQPELLGGDPARAIAAAASVHGAHQILLGEPGAGSGVNPAGVERRLAELTHVPVRAVRASRIGAEEQRSLA